MVRNAKPDFNRKLTMEDLRLPHIYDVMKILTEDDVTLLTANPGSTCVFMGGFEFEKEEFRRMSPKFFFIICDMLIGTGEVNYNDPLQGLRRRAQLVVPVILKGGYYYIIPGRENIPLYRIHNPEHFFFSTEGKSALVSLLNQWYCHNRGDALDLLFTREGKLLLYSLPKVTDSCGFPNEMWGNLTEEQIKPNIPFQLVHVPSVPTHALYSVQLVRLNDSNNIIDIDIYGRASEMP